jgi:AcrR family transcriptional regulator
MGFLEVTMEPSLSRILEAALEEFDEKGLRFTMDELAQRLGMSKRTLYEQVDGKEKIIELLVEETFRSIKDQERAILADTALPVADQLRRVLSIMPQFGVQLDYRKAWEIRKAYPAQYEGIQKHLAGDWETTLTLVEKGIAEGVFRPVNTAVLREILYSTMETMLTDKFLLQNNLTYEEALNQTLDILFSGLLSRPL